MKGPGNFKYKKQCQNRTVTKSPFPSYLKPLYQSRKRGFVHSHSHEIEFNLHMDEILFSYERMSTKTHFENEAKGNSEMAHSKSDDSFLERT